MSLYLLDTDTLSLLQESNPTVSIRVNSRPVADIAVSVITIQEQMRGALHFIGRARTRQQLASAYDRLVHQIMPAWHYLTVFAFPEPAILRFEHLRSLR